MLTFAEDPRYQFLRLQRLSQIAENSISATKMCSVLKRMRTFELRAVSINHWLIWSYVVDRDS